MRKFVFLAAALVAGAAQADYKPRVISDRYIATVSIHGGSLSYEESTPQGGPLVDVATEMLRTPSSLEYGLNNFLAREVARNGGTFVSGLLTGDIHVQLQPNASGTVSMTMSGLSYNVRTRFSGRKSGISYDCTNYLGLNNISIVAQYGTASGTLPASTVGMTANASSSTDCDSNISWILPFLGDKLINRVEGTADAEILAAMTSAMAGVKDSLFFKRDQNWLVGLNKLIPADKVVSLPNGGTFPIGQYVHSNLAYLIANSQINVKLGKGAPVGGVSGWVKPDLGPIVGDIVTMSLTVPGGNSFTVKLTQHDEVEWSWVCNLQRPQEVCYEP